MELLMSKRAMHGQSGVVLFVALVVLLALTVAIVAMMRAVNTSSVVAGNHAFREAARGASDRAIKDALNNLANITPSGSGNNNLTNRYFSTRQVSVDAKGIPTAVNWTNVSCVDETGGAVANCDTDVGKYRIQYVIERQCDSNPNLADSKDVKTKCDYEIRQQAQVGPPAVAEQIAIYYRVIVRVRGPRNSLAYYEVMLSGPATS